MTGHDGGAIILPLKRFDLLDPHLRVAIRLRLTSLNMIVTAPTGVKDSSPAGDAAMVEST